MSNKMKTVMAVLLLGVSSLSMAADLADDMDTLNSNLTKALGADSVPAFKQSLQNMRVAALDAQQALPPKLEGKATDSPERTDYRQGFTILVGQIDQAAALADQGKLPEAKKVAETMKDTRNTYHKKYR